MIEHIGSFLHFGTIAITVGLSSLGVGIGEGLTCQAALKASNTQPSAHNDIGRTAILGAALIETSAVMGVFISFLLLIGNHSAATTPISHIAELGVALAISLSGFIIGIVSSWPAQEACLAIARQPFFADKILRFMLITQSIIQTPIIFGFIIALFINSQAVHAQTIAKTITLIAAGLCIGVGSIGPAIGLALFAKNACRGLGINRKAYGSLLSFTFISQAIIETPIIFALTTSILLLFYNTEPTLLNSIAYLCAACCMSLGTLGTSIASGRTAAAAVMQIIIQPQLYSNISRVSMFAQGLIDTAAIYTFIIAFLLVFLS